MMKHVVILFAVFIAAQSQRPPYAGSNRPYPAVLPQYLEEQAAASSAPAAGNGDILNRAGEDNSSTTTTSTIPPYLPVDALGDVNLIEKIKTWPRDQQPFWFINWQQIQEHRGDTSHRTQPVPTEIRSSFAG